MKLKIDECLSPRAAAICRASGHDASTAFDEGLNGRSDPEILAAATAEGRTVITIDRGFGDARLFPPGSHAGIIVLRPNTNDKELILRLLEDVLKLTELETFVGCVVVVEFGQVRVLRPSTSD